MNSELARRQLACKMGFDGNSFWIQQRRSNDILTTAAGTWPGTIGWPGVNPICCMSAFFNAKWFRPFMSNWSFKCWGGWKYLHGGFSRLHRPWKQNKNNSNQVPHLASSSLSKSRERQTRKSQNIRISFERQTGLKIRTDVEVRIGRVLKTDVKIRIYDQIHIGLKIKISIKVVSTWRYDMAMK